MAVRLGDMLVRAGLITSSQLEEALKNQVIFGGRLGTNLIEIGAIREEDLARTLGEKLGVPFAPPEMLMSIHQDVIRLLPRTIAQQYRVIPFQLEKNRLSLVMSDPSDLSAIDEIAFITGYIIRPYVASEIRIALALEKYYQVRRDMRYIKIGEQMGRPEKPAERQTVPLPAAAPPTAQPAAAPRPAPSPPSPPRPAPQSAVAQLSELEELVELAELDMEKFEAPKEAPQPKRAEPPRVPPVENLAENLAEAKDRDAVADIMLAFLAGKVERSVIFLVKGSGASGWRGAVAGKAVANIDKCLVALDEPSVLKIVAEGKSLYLGPVPDTPANRLMLAPVGGTPGAQACFIPLVMMGRVVNVLMALLPPGDQSALVQELQALVKKASIAFEILILKNKILMA